MRTSEVGDVLEIWTPSEVRNYVNLVANAYKDFALDVQKDPIAFTSNELSSWNTLYRNFVEFYKGVGYFSTLTMSTVRTAETYAKSLSFWRNQYLAKGKITTGPDTLLPSDNADRILGTLQTISIMVAISAASIAVMYIIKSFKK